MGRGQSGQNFKAAARLPIFGCNQLIQKVNLLRRTYRLCLATLLALPREERSEGIASWMPKFCRLQMNCRLSSELSRLRWGDLQRPRREVGSGVLATAL